MKVELPMIFSSSGANYVSEQGSTFDIQFREALIVPREAQNITLEAVQSSIWWSIANIEKDVNDSLILSISGVDYDIKLESGLYDLTTLDAAINRAIVNATGQTTTYVNIVDDEATNKVILSFASANLEIDFTGANSMYEILGFEQNVYPLGGATTQPINILAPNVAKFNSIDYFVIHTDLITTGIPFNGIFNQSLSQVLIDAEPGSQIITRPYNPIKCDANNLAGSVRNSARFWLTDQNNNLVNTNTEMWSVLVVLKYDL
jgi:hypothetical protein